MPSDGGSLPPLPEGVGGGNYHLETLGSGMAAAAFARDLARGARRHVSFRLSKLGPGSVLGLEELCAHLLQTQAAARHVEVDEMGPWGTPRGVVAQVEQTR